MGKSSTVGGTFIKGSRDAVSDRATEFSGEQRQNCRTDLPPVQEALPASDSTRLYFCSKSFPMTPHNLMSRDLRSPSTHPAHTTVPRPDLESALALERVLLAPYFSDMLFSPPAFAIRSIG